MDPQAKATAMKEMDANEVAVCRNCVLCKSRNNTVFGEGDFNADLVFVGEAPGADEDQQGRPFVGRAGQLLTNMITAMGLSREQVFILNMVKCRPPNNRTPLPDEIHACWSYLVRQLQIIRPRVIVTLGNPAMQNLLQTRVGITKLRGNWQKLPEHAPGLGGIDVMPTFHPSYVLRRYTPEIRRRVWSDLQAVMQYLGLELPGKD
ncbi:MAG: uracil-DNA glycosylase [Phycisphaerae bacterium]